MTRSLFLAAAIAVAFGCFYSAPSASAGIIAADDFSYADGAVDQLNGGTGAWSTQWIGSGFNVVAGEVYGENALPANVNTVRRHFTNPAATNTLFASFDLRTGNDVRIDDGDYAALGLFFGVNGNILQVGKGLNSDDLVVGSGGFVSSHEALEPNHAYHIIAAYDVSNGRQSLWVNPVGTDFYDPSNGGSADATRIQAGGFGHANILYWDTTQPGYVLDNVVLSDTPDSAGLTAVPEPGSITLWSLGALGLCIAACRRKQLARRQLTD